MLCVTDRVEWLQGLPCRRLAFDAIEHLGIS